MGCGCKCPRAASHADYTINGRGPDPWAQKARRMRAGPGRAKKHAGCVRAQGGQRSTQDACDPREGKEARRMRAGPGRAKKHAGCVRAQAEQRSTQDACGPRQSKEARRMRAISGKHAVPGKHAALRKMHAAAGRSLWLDKHLAVSVKGKPVA